MPAQRIGDYAFLSDCNAAALVDREGYVDWYCLPRFDSPSVFGRMLGSDAGHWLLRPAGGAESRRAYVGDSLVLRTEYRAEGGRVEVLDALALGPGTRGHEIGLRVPHVLARRVQGLEGTVRMEMQFAPRFEYGLTVPRLIASDDGILARGGPVTLQLDARVPLETAGGTAGGSFEVGPGESVGFALSYAPSFGSEDPAPLDAGDAIEETIRGWESWAELHRGYEGIAPEQVRRSAVVLQGLTYQPSGAVLAAGTTSLPEIVGKEWNWDYRFAWLRDLSLTLQAQWVAACPHESERLFQWIAGALGRLDERPVQIMYGIRGERDLTEHELPHLEGFLGSRPVRVGNDAWSQKQLDVTGEVLDAAYLLKDQLGALGSETGELLVDFANHAAEAWRDRDAGMWEARDQERHYLSSKVLCWVALDRAVKLAPRLGEGADPTRWAEVRDEIHKTVLEEGWSEAAGAYTGAFGSDELDASVLLMPIVGFLPATDERMRATIERVKQELGEAGLVRRWGSDPSGFLITTYWLVECLALSGEIERAEQWFEQATGYANDLGLLSEEVDPGTGELLGNFPQAFSHIGLVNAAWRLTEATSADLAHPETP